MKKYELTLLFYMDELKLNLDSYSNIGLRFFELNYNIKH